MVKSYKEAIEKFKDEQVCRDYLVQQRWNGVPTCPYCGSTKSYNIENGKRFKCGNKECYKKYSVTVGTIFEATNISLSTWFAAMYVITAHKKGISSVQLAKDIGVTQKTGWFMLHRIRESLKESNPAMLKGVVEVDESYMSRKYASDFKGLPANEIQEALDSKTRGKGAAIGAIQRGGDVIVKAISGRNAKDITEFVHKNVSKDVRLMTDESILYKKGLADYNRKSVDHSIRQWTIGDIHTNTIENFWSVMKRGIYGIYHQVSYKHLQRYCDEFAYRYNTRKLHDGFRFTLSLQRIEGRLKYSTLINGEEGKK